MMASISMVPEMPTNTRVAWDYVQKTVWTTWSHFFQYIEEKLFSLTIPSFHFDIYTIFIFKKIFNNFLF